MVDRFLRYNRLPKTVQVENMVLFGDRKDVQLNNLNRPPQRPGPHSTINFEVRPGVAAVPGLYHHGEVVLQPEGTRRRLHVVHHQKVDGTALGRWLCKVDGHDKLGVQNVINRYDWCHYRNWGACNDEKVYFVAPALDGTGRIALDPSSCISGDWYFGLRLTDPQDCDRAYAFVFGDALVTDLLHGCVNQADLVSCRAFMVPMCEFVLVPVEPCDTAESTASVALEGSRSQLLGPQMHQDNDESDYLSDREGEESPWMHDEEPDCLDESDYLGEGCGEDDYLYERGDHFGDMRGFRDADLFPYSGMYGCGDGNLSDFAGMLGLRDPDTEYIFLREDGDAEYKTMEWLQFNREPRLCQGVYGCRNAWARLSDEQRKALRMEGDDLSDVSD